MGWSVTCPRLWFLRILVLGIPSYFFLLILRSFSGPFLFVLICQVKRQLTCIGCQLSYVSWFHLGIGSNGSCQLALRMSYMVTNWLSNRAECAWSHYALVNWHEMGEVEKTWTISNQLTLRWLMLGSYVSWSHSGTGSNGGYQLTLRMSNMVTKVNLMSCEPTRNGEGGENNDDKQSTDTAMAQARSK